MAKDYYEILGLQKGASKEEIKKAYKTLAKKYHPDISKEEDAEKKFKEINEAAGVLLDDQKRQRYDTYGSADGGAGGFGGFGGGGGFDPRDFGINLDDIFEQFGFGSAFGGFGGFGSSQRGKTRQKDTTVYTKIDITLDEVYFGCEKEVKVQRDKKCETCHGKGAVKSSDIETCSKCDGKGYTIEVQRTILGQMRTQRPCYKCHGEGKSIKNPCSSCNGTGHVSEKENMQIKIPKGVEDGVTLRVTGKGHYDKNSESYGDLYVKINVNKHKYFDVDGSDLYMNSDVNFIQAILGDEIEFKHFDKTLSMKIPSGTQSGTVLRLKGKGLPYFNYDSHGDLYVKINVEIPTKVTKEQKEILHDYAKTLKDKSFLGRLKSLFK